METGSPLWEMGINTILKALVCFLYKSIQHSYLSSLTKRFNPVVLSIKGKNLKHGNNETWGLIQGSEN
jgi:hypothetical protein